MRAPVRACDARVRLELVECRTAVHRAPLCRATSRPRIIIVIAAGGAHRTRAIVHDRRRRRRQRMRAPPYKQAAGTLNGRRRRRRCWRRTGRGEKRRRHYGARRGARPCRAHGLVRGATLPSCRPRPEELRACVRAIFRVRLPYRRTPPLYRPRTTRRPRKTIPAVLYARTHADGAIGLIMMVLLLFTLRPCVFPTTARTRQCCQPFYDTPRGHTRRSVNFGGTSTSPPPCAPTTNRVVNKS